MISSLSWLLTTSEASEGLVREVDSDAWGGSGYANESADDGSSKPLVAIALIRDFLVLVFWKRDAALFLEL